MHKKTNSIEKNVQLSLGIEDEIEPEIEKFPRPKNIPADLQTKNTDASASVFGWRFQVVVGIILSLDNIRTLKSVEIEGSTEDIELYFNDKEPEYIQVKSVQGNPIDIKDNAKATLAMNTLINTSNITQGKYSKLVYVSNFKNILGLKNPLLDAVWYPNGKEPFVQAYTALPSKAKSVIQGRITRAKDQLSPKYSSSTVFFDVNRLYLATILFSSDDQDEQKYSTLEGAIEKLFGELRINIRRAKIRNVKDMLVNRYLSNAGSKDSKENHEKISKNILVWRMIFEIIDDIPNDFYENVPVGIEDELDSYANHFILQQVEDIEIINRILSGLNIFADGILLRKNVVQKFIDTTWENYKDIFPLDDSSIVQEYGIKMIMMRVLNGQRTIEKIKEGVNL